MIKIIIESDDNGNTSVEMKVDKPSAIEVQAVNSQLDMIKMKMLNELMKMTTDYSHIDKNKTDN